MIKTIVREEGHPDGIWGDAGICLPWGEVLVEVALNKRADLGDNIFTAQNVAEDIAHIQVEGFEVDNNNDPAPENIPANGDVQPINLDLYEGQLWGWDGVNRRITMGGGGLQQALLPQLMDTPGQVISRLVFLFLPNGVVEDRPPGKDK